VLDPSGGGALPPSGSSPSGPSSPGPDLRPRGIWIAFVVVALGVPILAWALKAC
jgi:hypothetical protein